MRRRGSPNAVTQLCLYCRPPLFFPWQKVACTFFCHWLPGSQVLLALAASPFSCPGDANGVWGSHSPAMHNPQSAAIFPPALPVRQNEAAGHALQQKLFYHSHTRKPPGPVEPALAAAAYPCLAFRLPEKEGQARLGAAGAGQPQTSRSSAFWPWREAGRQARGRFLPGLRILLDLVS